MTAKTLANPTTKTISYFASVRDQQPRSVGSLADVAKLIADPTKHDPALHTRLKSPGEATRKAAKLKLPAVTFRGKCERRREGLIAHSGYDVFDCDYLASGEELTSDQSEQIQAKMAHDPHIALAYVSPSGRLKIVMPASDFETCADYLHDHCLITASPSQQDDVRLSYICHDPNVIFNPDAQPLAAADPLVIVGDDSEPPKNKIGYDFFENPRQGWTPDQLEVSLGAIPSDDRDEWLRVLSAAHHEFAGSEHEQAVITILDDWSKTTSANNYEQGCVKKAWRSFRGKPNPSTLASVAHLARKYKQHDEPYPPLSSADIAKLSFDTTKGGALKPSHYNIYQIFLHDKLFATACRYESTQGTYSINKKEGGAQLFPRDDYYRDDLTSVLVNYIKNRYDISVTGPQADLQFREITRRINKFTAAHEHVTSLPAWDGVDRISHWAINYFGAEDSEQTRLASRKLLLSVAQRALSPGSKLDSCFILEGPQGVGKSSFLELLASSELYAECAANFGQRGDHNDAVRSMAGKLIVELPEFNALRRTDQNEAKGFIARGHDVYRLPYARDMSEIPRTFVLAATINPNGAGYLMDTTGNRRYVPIVLPKRFDRDVVRNEREQLLAEAVQAVRNGEHGWLTEDDELVISTLNKDRQLVDYDTAVAVADFIAAGEGVIKTKTGIYLEAAPLYAHVKAAHQRLSLAFARDRVRSHLTRQGLEATTVNVRLRDRQVRCHDVTHALDQLTDPEK